MLHEAFKGPTFPDQDNLKAKVYRSIEGCVPFQILFNQKDLPQVDLN